MVRALAAVGLAGWIVICAPAARAQTAPAPADPPAASPDAPASAPPPDELRLRRDDEFAPTANETAEGDPAVTPPAEPGVLPSTEPLPRAELPGEGDPYALPEEEPPPLPRLDGPWQVVAGGGVGVAVNGPTQTYVHTIEELRYHPDGVVEGFLFGLTAAQYAGPNFVFDVAALAGYEGDFFSTDGVLATGALMIQLGGGGNDLFGGFVFNADLDIKLLFARRFMIFARGGFFSLTPSALTIINADVGLGLSL